MSEIKKWKAIGLHDDTTAEVGQTIRVKTVDENNLPTEWEAVNIQADWNQNDETASDCIKNRPFGIEVGAILPETTIEVPDGSDGELPIETEIDLVEGNTYIVTWNGVEYTCVAQKWEIDGVTRGIIIGDLGFVNTGELVTGEPFIIGDLNEEMAAEIGVPTVLGVFDGSTSVTVSIKGEVVKKIDNKYLEPFEIVNNTEIAEVFPETELSLTVNDGWPQYTSNFIPIVAGKTYNVIYDNVEYECICKTHTVEDITTKYLGSLEFMSGSDNSEYPFAIISNRGLNNTVFYSGSNGEYGASDVAHPHTFAIYLNENKNTVRIKTEYLPEPLQFGNEITEILLETTSTIDPEVSNNISLPNIINVVEGNVYIVNYNGAGYTCTAQAYTENGMSAICLGNLGAITGGENTGEPFVIVCNNAEVAAEMGAGVGIMPLDGSTSVTLSITGKVIKKLNSKYLDEALQFGETIKELLPETTLEIDWENMDGAVPYPNKIGLIVGTTYAVQWNGVEYNCIAQDVYVPNNGSTIYFGVGVGNVGAMTGGENTGEPFAIVDASLLIGIELGVPCLIQAVDESITSVTLSITGPGIKKLNNKYLDLEWTPSKKPATRVEVFPETIVNATGDTILLTEEFIASAEDKAPYIVTWNGKEYICNAMFLSNQFTIGNLYLINNTNFAPNTGEPFLFFTTGQNLTISYTDEGSATFKIDRGYYDTLPHEFAPANYTITTDIPANKEATNDGQLSQAEYVLKHGGKVFATVDGRDVEILSMIADTVDSYHNFSWRDRLNGNIYTMPGAQTNWKAQTPAVDRMDILLRYDNSSSSGNVPPKKFKFTVDENGNLMSSDEDGTNQKKYLTESDGSGLNVPVTSADNGKFLRVVDGAWAASIPEDYVTEEELNSKGYLTQHQSLADYAKTSEVDTKIANLVNSAPDKLNTLDELAAALGDDENFANTVTTELGKKINSSDLASWAKAANKPTYTASEVGAAPSSHTHTEYAPKASPVFTGSISLGRKANSTIGTNSVAEGKDTTASGHWSHAEGYNTTASGIYSHAEGY